MSTQKNILVVFYSRSGKTKKVAEEISKSLNCDIEEIKETISRKGIFGWLKSGYQNATRKFPPILPIEKDPANYDLVLIGAPVWAGISAAPARTYIRENISKIKNIALISTKGGSSTEKIINYFEELSGKKAIAFLDLVDKSIKKDSYSEKLTKFIDEIRNS